MKLTFKNVLITGGAGFIGSNIASKLVDKGVNVTVLDSLSEQIHGQKPEETSPLYLSIKDKVKFIKGSVTSREDWLKAIDGQEAIIHLAAETGTGQSMYEIEKYVNTNIGGTALMLDIKYVNTNIGGTALMLDILTNAKHNVKRVIVAESRAIYGEGKYYSPLLEKDVYPEERLDENMCKGEFECTYPNAGKLQLVATTEDSKIHPSSVYGITKQVQGQLVHLVCPSIGIDAVSYRYQNVYGPGQSLSNPYTGILSIFSTRIKNGNEINIFEDGKETRDFVFIEDVVDATILGLETKEAAGHAFNIGTGISTDVLTVAHTLCEKYNMNVPITISGNYRLGDIRHNYADIALARTILGYEPKWSFSDGIGEFCKWVRPCAEQHALRQQDQLLAVDIRRHHAPNRRRSTPPRGGTESSYSSSEISPRTTVSPASSCNFSTCSPCPRTISMPFPVSSSTCSSSKLCTSLTPVTRSFSRSSSRMLCICAPSFSAIDPTPFRKAKTLFTQQLYA